MMIEGEAEDESEVNRVEMREETGRTEADEEQEKRREREGER